MRPGQSSLFAFLSNDVSRTGMHGRRDSRLQALQQFLSYWSIQAALEFGKCVRRQGHARRGGPRLELAMHVVRDVAHLNHRVSVRVFRVQAAFPRMNREHWIIGGQPKKRARVYQRPHVFPAFASKASSRSSGSGSKTLSGILMPRSIPIGRRSSTGWPMGRSSATGTFRRQMMILRPFYA